MTTIMPAGPLTHEALLYSDDEEFLAVAVPFLLEGMARDEAVVAAATWQNLQLLRDGLGVAARRVTLIDRDAWYQRPASTVAGWRRLVDDAAAQGQRRLRIIGEVGFGAGERHASWARYESAINAVFAGTPAWIVCPYDRRVLPDQVIDNARRTHPVLVDGARAPSVGYEQPSDFLITVTEPLPPVSGSPVVQMMLTGLPSAAAARAALSAAAHATGWSSDRLDDAMLTLSEIVINSIDHGDGDRSLSIWVSGDALTCEVSDQGRGIADPLAGFRWPGAGQRHGRGLWMACQLSDWIGIDRADGVTRVRFTFLA